MRPKIELSNSICTDTDKDGRYYAFKIVNNTSYNLIDLRAEMILKTPVNSNGGPNYTHRWITLKKENILLFPKYNKKDAKAEYALVLGTREDLSSLWTDQAQFLQVKIHLKHSFSGISKSFVQEYYTKKSCIKDGMFNFGKSFEIS
ncbi:hypothetical protein GCM10022289_47460 [Pedobacter jeongneungensis]|uniref:Uncharacterized protein n=2 Tax=Pedobacter jeongneungensis TaxID=947309 RepID=A0ABP8BQP3_9SPHI